MVCVGSKQRGGAGEVKGGCVNDGGPAPVVCGLRPSIVACYGLLSGVRRQSVLPLASVSCGAAPVSMRI